MNTLLTPFPLKVYKQKRCSDADLKKLGIRLGPTNLNVDQFLVSETTGAPVGAFLQYFKAEGAGWRPSTKESYVDDLKDFADFLDANDIALTEITEEALKGYLNSMTEVVSPVTERPYEAETISKRLSTAKGFSLWASKKELLDTALPTIIDVTYVPVNEDEFAHLGGKPVQRIDTSIEGPDRDAADEKVHVLSPEDVDLLLPALGELPPPWRECKEAAPEFPVVDRLRAELSLATGLRRAEVCNLGVHQIMNASLDLDDPLRSSTLRVRRKGGRIKSFLAPTWLVFAMQQYARYERSVAVAWAKAHRQGYGEPFNLFVNGMTAKRNRGGACDPKSLGRVFTQVQKRIEMTSLGPRNSVKLGSKVAKYRFHDLRHTYVIWTYLARKAANDAEPWIFISGQIGHKHVHTTIAIYLRPAQAIEAVASARFYREMRTLREMYG